MSVSNIEIERVTRAQAEKWGPKFLREPIPTWRTKTEAYKWKETQEAFWYNGYNELDGWYYKYLSQCKIKNAIGQMIAPWWRDGDDFIVSQTTSHAVKNGRDKFTVKRREFGLSSWDGGFMPLEYAMRYPGSSIKMTSYSEGAIEELMMKKIVPMAEHFFLESETAWKKMFGMDAVLWKPKMAYTKANMTMTIDFGDGVVSTITGVQTTRSEKDTGNMEGGRNVYVFIDEYFRHRFPNKVRNSADACRKEGFQKIGIISLGGSAGESTEEGALAAREIWETHEDLGMDIVFLPGSLCINKAPQLDDNGREILGAPPLSFMVNGYSLQAEAEEWINKTCEKFKKLRDKSYYNSFRKSYPRTIEDIFETLGDNTWDESDRDRFNEQRKRIYIATSKFEPYSLDLRSDNTINFRRVTQSAIEILEEPKSGNDYIIGVDPIPILSRDKKEDRSDFAVTVKNRTQQKYVLRYNERTNNIALLENNLFKIWLAYSGKPYTVELERNRGDSLYVQSCHQGHDKMFAKEPFEWRPNNAKVFDIGYAKTGHNADTMAGFLMKFARMYDKERNLFGIENIWDLMMLDQVEKFNVGNKDIADAMISCEILDWDLSLKEEKIKNSNQQKSTTNFVPYITIENGVRVVKYIDLNQSALPQSRGVNRK
jgi:hypothetical protein